MPMTATSHQYHDQKDQKDQNQKYQLATIPFLSHHQNKQLQSNIYYYNQTQNYLHQNMYNHNHNHNYNQNMSQSHHHHQNEALHCYKNQGKYAIQCANCGCFGHIYKNCNHPITSYGIISFKVNSLPDGTLVPSYLLVQRKDSLSYVEFIRGKYSIDQRTYLMRLFSNMTPTERQSLTNNSFDHLWKTLWQSEDCKGFVKEYNEAKNKFEMLKRGYVMKNKNNEVYYVDIEYIVNNTVCVVEEPEWGFPKGRRNINEHDFNCALREFKEETGMHPRNIRVVPEVKPFEEIFSGTNKVRYKHIYYIAYCNHADLSARANNREIKAVKWFTYEEAQGKINNHNIERKELFKRVDSLVGKLCSINGDETGKAVQPQLLCNAAAAAAVASSASASVAVAVVSG